MSQMPYRQGQDGSHYLDMRRPLHGVERATQRCWISDYQGKIYGVTVTATTIEGKHIRFDIAVDSKPTNRPA